jgi:putative ABC transport system permease protein
MKKFDVLSIAFGNFKRRKTRSVLTVLGVIIGVTSIVVMVSLGIAVKVSYDESLSQIGDLTTITVMPGFDPSTGKQTGELNDDLVKQLSALDHVTAVSSEINLYGKLISGCCNKAWGNPMAVSILILSKPKK